MAIRSTRQIGHYVGNTEPVCRAPLCVCVARPVAVVEVVVEVWTKAHLPVSGRQPVGGAGERGTYLQFLDHLDVDPSATSDRRFVSRKGGGKKKSGGGDSENGQVWVCSSLYSRIQSCVLFCHIGMPLLKGSERETKKKKKPGSQSLCFVISGRSPR